MKQISQELLHNDNSGNWQGKPVFRVIFIFGLSSTNHNLGASCDISLNQRFSEGRFLPIIGTWMILALELF